MAWEVRDRHLVWPNAGTGLVERRLEIEAPAGAIFVSDTVAEKNSVVVDVLLRVYQPDSTYLGRYVTIAFGKTAATP